MNPNNQPTSGENTWYYIINILTLGSLYFTKITIKRAIQEAAAPKQAATNPVVPKQ